jgi:hypothetical protein
MLLHYCAEKLHFHLFHQEETKPSFNLTTVKTVQLGKSVYRHPAY